MVESEPRRDPEKAERSYLRRYTSQSVGRVLDIGCGDGRLTWFYAPDAELAVGIDVDVDDLQDAKSRHPEADPAEAFFAASEGEALPFVSEQFDLALFSWSL